MKQITLIDKRDIETMKNSHIGKLFTVANLKGKIFTANKLGHVYEPVSLGGADYILVKTDYYISHRVLELVKDKEYELFT